MVRTILASMAVVALFATSSYAATIAQWTYETADPPDITNNAVGPVTPADVGLGTATSLHARTQTDYTNPSGNGSTRSQSSNEWTVGDYYQFQVSSLLYKDIILDWDQTRSGTGPPTFNLQYSTDGINFTNSGYTVLENNAGNGGTWNTTTFIPNYHFNLDLSAVDGLENQALLTFRLTATAIGSSTNGTNRVDNFTVSGIEIPEPATAMLVAMAGLAVIGIGRRVGR